MDGRIGRVEACGCVSVCMYSMCVNVNVNVCGRAAVLSWAHPPSGTPLPSLWDGWMAPSLCSRAAAGALEAGGAAAGATVPMGSVSQ